MGFTQRFMHEMTAKMGETPLCIREGAATTWAPHFCWLPTRIFNFKKGFGRWVWLRTIERRFCRSAHWLHPLAVWSEYRFIAPPPEPPAEKEG